MVNVRDLKHIALKGEGYFCIVKQYEDEKTGQCYALKLLKKEHYPREDYRYRLLKEIKLLNELQDCENIIELINHGNDKENQELWYLMPFVKTNLYNYIKSNNSTMTPLLRYQIIEQVINAIKFAHGKSILHRDISPNNILIVFKGGNPIVKVCDFGLGKDTESLSYYTKSSASGYGQILYVSPEQREQLKSATERSDIYSLGKLVYFVFTGKDPDNIKSFELSTLVNKAIEENPINRHENINEFEAHFKALKELHLNQEIPIEYVILKEFIKSEGSVDFVKLHELFVAGNYIGHVYDDYIAPVNGYLLTDDNLTKYYKNVGNGIRDFVRTYFDRLTECYRTLGWPFASMTTFGRVLVNIIKTVSDDETRLICFKQLWFLAFEADQWDVQRQIKQVFNNRYITKPIEIQLSEYIISTEMSIDLGQFNNLEIPQSVKLGIIKSNEIAKVKKEERDKKLKEEL